MTTHGWFYNQTSHNDINLKFYMILIVYPYIPITTANCVTLSCEGCLKGIQTGIISSIWTDTKQHSILQVCSGTSQPIHTWYPCSSFSHSHATPDKVRECLHHHCTQNYWETKRQCIKFCQNLGKICTEIYNTHALPADHSSCLLRGQCPLQAIRADMLHWVWDEFDYRMDVCRLTQGAHIEGLWLMREKLGQLPLLTVYVVPV
jgi:hypothetical protein